MGETIMVRRTGQAPLRVRGTVVAHVYSSLDSASPEYSGSLGRAEEVRIIRTSSGKYVAGIEHITQWQGENDSYEAAVYSSAWQCMKYVAERVPGWLVDRLTQKLLVALGEEAVAEEVA